MVSNASPLALIASSRRSRSKNPGCPIARHHTNAIHSRTESDLRSSGQKLFFGGCPRE
jgi:hypothetical protein